MRLIMLIGKTKKAKSWGGKRKGAGRKYGEPTKTLSYRVPEKLAEQIDKRIKELIFFHLTIK